MLEVEKAAERLEDDLRDYRDEQLTDALEDARTEAVEEARTRLKGKPATQAEFRALSRELYAGYAERARKAVEELVEAQRSELLGE